MKNRGFTLVELLVTIGILALLLLIAAPTVDYIISNSQEKTYQETVNNIKEAARLYFAQKPYLLPQEIGDESKVTIEELKNNGYLDKNIVDPRTDELIGGMITVIYTTESVYEYEYSTTVNISTDTTQPVLTLLGNNPVTYQTNASYMDPGATALDNVDGDITSKITTTSNFNPNKVGTYTVTYTVSDSSGNIAIATRTINVVDTAAPIITFSLNGNTTYAKSHSTVVNVTDPEGSLNTSSLEYQWTTSIVAPTEASFTTAFTNGSTISTPNNANGSYYLWILAKDTYNNTTIKNSNIFNLDNTAPVITMNGTAPMSLYQFVSYADEGASANDNIDGYLTDKMIVTSSVNTSIIGENKVTYRVTDAAGNTSIATRNITVYPYKTCMAIKAAGYGTKDGVYTIDPNGGSYSDDFNAYCDMTTSGGGWTLVWSNLRAKINKPTTNMTWANATGTNIFVNGTMSDDKESFEVYTGLSMWNNIINNTQGEFRIEWRYDYGVNKTQEAVFIITPFTSADTYTLRLSGYSQTVGSTTPGLWSYHKNNTFKTYEGGSCSANYSGTPFWYVSCWDGSMNGGGQNSGSGYYNGAYWSGSSQAWGASNGTGAGNAWYWLR